MDASSISAFAAFTGAVAGGAASFLASWLGQRHQFRAQWLTQDKLRRQNVYKEFIEEASKCYIDALQHHKPDILVLVALYAKTSEMRVVSSPVILKLLTEEQAKGRHTTPPTDDRKGVA